jgi:hypothetical protein
MRIRILKHKKLNSRASKFSSFSDNFTSFSFARVPQFLLLSNFCIFRWMLLLKFSNISALFSLKNIRKRMFIEYTVSHSTIFHSFVNHSSASLSMYVNVYTKKNCLIFNLRYHSLLLFMAKKIYIPFNSLLRVWIEFECLNIIHFGFLFLCHDMYEEYNNNVVGGRKSESHDKSPLFLMTFRTFRLMLYTFITTTYHDYCNVHSGKHTRKFELSLWENKIPKLVSKRTIHTQYFVVKKLKLLKNRITMPFNITRLSWNASKSTYL